MNLREDTKTLIKRNRFMYDMLYMIRHKKDRRLWNCIDAYIYGEKPVFVVENDKTDSQQGIYYAIQFDRNSVYGQCGFFAMVRYTLLMLNFAERYGFRPVIMWGSKFPYYDPKRKDTANAFEYYFEQPYISSAELGKTKRRKVEFKDSDLSYFIQYKTYYDLNEKDIQNLSAAYRRYFRLNKETDAYISGRIKQLFGNRNNRKAVGVHIRGGDFKKNFKAHPQYIPAENYLEAVKNLIRDRADAFVFVATDDAGALDLFQKEFGDRCLCYSDIERTDGDDGTCLNSEKNPCTLGLEVLLDAYTLAHCGSLVCGLSQVSFGARYIKRSRGGEYDDLRILDAGINRDGPNCYQFYNKLKNSRG